MDPDIYNEIEVNFADGALNYGLVFVLFLYLIIYRHMM